MIHAGNCIHEDCMANHVQREVLDCWQSSETRVWSSGLSARISRCSCWYTICASIAWWCISSNWSANPRSCQCLFCFLHLDWTYDDNPRNIHSSNERLVPFEGIWQREVVELLSAVTGWLYDQRLGSESKSGSPCLTILISRRSWMTRSPAWCGWKFLT